MKKKAHNIVYALLPRECSDQRVVVALGASKNEKTGYLQIGEIDK